MELIKNRDVDTQEELLMLLRAAGFECTQATVSRDIRELKIVKASNGKGGYRYVSATLPTSEHIATKFAKILADTVCVIFSQKGRKCALLENTMS